MNDSLASMVGSQSAWPECRGIVRVLPPFRRCQEIATKRPMDIRTELSEVELLARIAQGDQEAFSLLYERLSGCLFSFAMRMLRDETLAEDVMQDLFFQIWERAGNYKPELGKPLTWAVAMVRNRAIDKIRAKARGQRLIEAATQEQESAPLFSGSSDDALIGRETAERVRAALAGLPVDHRQAIEMAFFRGLTQTEIAAALDAPLGTVKARIRRGMMQMRETLQMNLSELN